MGEAGRRASCLSSAVGAEACLSHAHRLRDDFVCGNFSFIPGVRADPGRQVLRMFPLMKALTTTTYLICRHKPPSSHAMHDLPCTMHKTPRTSLASTGPGPLV